jgi:mRNA interferase RelE/StbE
VKPYRIDILPTAKKALAELPRNLQKRIDQRILSLADDPCPPGAVKIQGMLNGWRIRVGDYRILYTIENDRLLILIIRIGHRRDVYRRL